MSEEKKVEQDERGAFEAWIRNCDGYPYAGQYANLMWKAWQARAASTSANVAQGAEAVAVVDENDDGLFVEILQGEDGTPLKCGDKLYAAPPAQTALTTEQITDIRRAAVLIRENSYPCPDKPHSNWALADRIDKIVGGDKS